MVARYPARILLKLSRILDLLFRRNKLVKMDKQITSLNLQSKGNPFLAVTKK
jgi:hypothetical protein